MFHTRLSLIIKKRLSLIFCCIKIQLFIMQFRTEHHFIIRLTFSKYSKSKKDITQTTENQYKIIKIVHIAFNILLTINSSAFLPNKFASSEKQDNARTPESLLLYKTELLQQNPTPLFHKKQHESLDVTIHASSV